MYKYKSKFKHKIFTLAEIMVVTVAMGLIMITVISFYFKMMRIKIDAEARALLLQNSYYTFEKLNVMLQNYTIDYEEYFNRRMVGCDTNNWWNSFVWDVSNNGVCDRFTNYGNVDRSNLLDQHWIYYCSSKAWGSQPNDWIVLNWSLRNIPSLGWRNGCRAWTEWMTQWFGTYKNQFWDLIEDTDGDGNIRDDDDDDDLGQGPIAIGNNTGVQELYFIHKNGRKRLFMRRRLLESVDYDNNGITWDQTFENYFTIEMLRLKWFDAWSGHDFVDSPSVTTYDGQIDTWACDFSEGFICNWATIHWGGWAYEDYHLASSVNDGWVSMFNNDLTIVNWDLQVYPPVDPEFAWGENFMQINPFFRIKIQTKLYGWPWYGKIDPVALNAYQLDLQTSFNIKSYY